MPIKQPTGPSIRTKIKSWKNRIGDQETSSQIEIESAYQQLKATEEQLYHSLEKYEILIESMSDIFWITDTEGSILFINDVVQNILGYSKAEVIGHKLFEFMCPLHQYQVGSCVNVVAQMKTRDFKKEEMWMLHSDGHTRLVLEVNSKRIHFEDNVVEIQGLARDITERIRLERKIKNRTKQLELINDISASIAYDLLKAEPVEMFETIGNKLTQELNIPLFTVRLLSGEGIFEQVVESGPLKDKVRCWPIPADNKKIQQIFTEKKVQTIHGLCHRIFDYPDDSKVQEESYKTLMIPMLSNQLPIGLLTVGLPIEDDKDLDSLLMAVANQLSLAVEKSNLYRDIRNFYLKIIKSLIAAMEAKDVYTQGHSVRVSQYAMTIGAAMGLATQRLEELEIACLLHDIGKIGINDAILTKAGILDAEEYAKIKEHPQIGARILAPIGFSQEILDAVLFHHKRYDLTGYPETLTFSNQSTYVSIIAVADTLDAMTSNRSYKKKISKEAVLEEFRRHSGTQFCPVVVEILLSIIHEHQAFKSCFEERSEDVECS